MSLICAISGEVPEEPVVSPASGRVFERRLIEKHLRNSDKDPVSGAPLTVDDLVTINTALPTRARGATATSVPALLKLLQDEWDATMLEQFRLRQHVDSVRQELAHALYQHDAACRVIARLTRERDQARAALGALQPGALQTQDAAPAAAPAAAAPASMEGVVSEAYRAEIEAMAATLSEGRKKRSKPDGLASVEEVRGLGVRASHTGVHSATAQITCLDTKGSLTVSGSTDKKAVVFDTKTETVVATFSEHSKKVNKTVLHPSEDVAVSCGADNTVRVWKASTGEPLHVIKAHSKSVEDVSLHPTGHYVLSASLDNTWAFSDIRSGETLFTGSDPEGAGAKGLTRVQVHPDGLIFAVGSGSGQIRIWDLCRRTVLASFEGHKGSVTALAFSENGYLFASGAEDSTVILWDLRHQKSVKTLALDAGHEVNALDFDHSGTYLAVAGSDIRILLGKKLEPVAELTGHSAPVTGVKWGALAKSLVTAGKDRAIKVFE